ncbi:TonB-dependent receptor domain protein, partial [mine drainage metagenome]
APTNSTQPAYTVWNAALGIGLPRLKPLHSLRLNFAVLNLFNKHYNTIEYYSSGGYFVVPQSVGALLAYPGAPRTAYVALTARF